MAKQRKPRFRYVVFRIESARPFEEGGMLEALAFAFQGRPPRLVVFTGSGGIVRCLNVTKDETIGKLNSIHDIGGVDVTVRTVGTSGTIRKARDKFLR